MFAAMNRSFISVILGGFGAVTDAGAGGKVKLTLQAGRGYVVGSPGKANVPFSAP